MARKQSKDPLERLDTPAPATLALLHYVRALRGAYVIEPCAGANAITNTLVCHGDCAVKPFDIEPRAPLMPAADTSVQSFWDAQVKAHDYRETAVVTNTPFSLASKYWHLTRGFGLVALLVRLSWLEATVERETVDDPDNLIILPRQKFTGPGAIDPETGKPYTGGDSVTVAWALWFKGAYFLRPAQPIIRVSRHRLRDITLRAHSNKETTIG